LCGGSGEGFGESAAERGGQRSRKRRHGC
jgi:hypothetical protein